VRPPVTLLVPFLGTRSQEEDLIARLARIDTRPDDELIVVDNRPGTAVGEIPAGRVRVLRAGARRSPWYARNEGAARARNAWLLFVDGDCDPPRTLLDDFFAPAPGDGCGVVAGEVVGMRDQAAVLARWARSRRQMMASHHLAAGPMPAGIAANLLVSREAWEAVGGFVDAAAADVELCWLIQRAGLRFAYRPNARVAHRDPEQIAAVARQALRYGRGRRRLRWRYGRTVPPVRLATPVGRAVAGAMVWAVTGRFERALFKLIDGAWTCVLWWGYVAAGSRRTAPRKLD
jgi:GT2 family glycosyltransferase